nr:hypothetical protein [Tanacetum cinerariifolium]
MKNETRRMAPVEVRSLTRTKVETMRVNTLRREREAKAVDDFLWEMEQYLEGINVVDVASKIKMETRYLKDTTTL